MKNRPPRIVVVDDAPFARSFIKNVLQEEGFEVVAEGTDGFEALELLERHAPDLLTLDIIMPGMDGLSALAEIARLPAPCPVVVVSSVSDEEVFFRAIKLGARDFVGKPIEPLRFLDAVRKALKRQ